MSYEELFIINMKAPLRIDFNVPIELDPKKKYKCGLKYFSVYNTIKNITDKNNKIKYSKDQGATWITKTIPPGSYEIREITKAIDDEENLIFTDHPPTNKVQLILKNGRQVDFTADFNFREVLGFKSEVYKETCLAPYTANINNSINSINIRCNIITGGYLNNQLKNIIFSIPSFTVPIGYKIIEQPARPVYLPLNTSLIQNISLNIQDDNGHEIDFGNEIISIQLHLKESEHYV